MTLISIVLVCLLLVCYGPNSSAMSRTRVRRTPQRTTLSDLAHLVLKNANGALNYTKSWQNTAAGRELLKETKGHEAAAVCRSLERTVDALNYPNQSVQLIPLTVHSSLCKTSTENSSNHSGNYVTSKRV